MTGSDPRRTRVSRPHCPPAHAERCHAVGGLGFAAVVATLPPADDRLYGPDTFGASWLVGAVVAVALAVGGLAWALWPRRRVRIPAEPAGTLGLRQRYLRRLDDLEQQVTAHELTARALHHELSRTLRRFAVELGTPGATSMSSGTLDGAGQRAVAAAVRRFEHPQFEANPHGDPLVALAVARAVVTDTDGPSIVARATHDEGPTS